MRLLTWFGLVALAGLAVFWGRLDVALLCGGLKAVLVGSEFMELRHAHRLHLAAFVLWAVGLTSVLLLVSR